MTEDARFEDGAEQPLRLRAETADDLQVLATLVQDAVGQTTDIAWMPRRRRLALLVSRFRWEDAARAGRQGRPFERVRALLVVENALRVRASGINPRDRDLVVSILTLDFAPGEDGTGVLRLTLAGDGEIAVDVEALEVTLTDVTRPYAAQSGVEPSHPDERG
jgi:hypothetical protein